MKKEKADAILISGVALCFFAIILLLCFFMNGQITINGAHPEPYKAQSISCESSSFVYPFFEYDNALEKSSNVNIMLENNTLSIISFIYRLTYPSEEEITKSEAFNHAAINRAFVDSSLKADAIGANYSKFNGGLRFSLYATSSDLTNGALKFLMLDGLGDEDLTSELIKETYEQLGFKCTSSEDN